MKGELRVVRTGGPGLPVHPGVKGPRRRRYDEPELALEDGCVVVVMGALEKKNTGVSFTG